MGDYDLAAAQLERGWRDLREDIDHEFQRSTTPTAIFIGAQPAAGEGT